MFDGYGFLVYIRDGTLDERDGTGSEGQGWMGCE